MHACIATSLLESSLNVPSIADALSEYRPPKGVRDLRFLASADKWMVMPLTEMGKAING